MKSVTVPMIFLMLFIFLSGCGGTDTGNSGNDSDIENSDDDGNSGNDSDSECIESDRRCVHTSDMENNDEDSYFAYSDEAVEICLNGKWQQAQRCYDYETCENGFCKGPDMDLKPNIYLYPKNVQQISVVINFPVGGQVTVSEPLYNTGWDVTVTPDGIIDDEYTFLFYESVQPDMWQKNEGWVVETENLEEFFVTTLDAYGFKGNEITDFIEWWVPRLVDFPYYIIYPQISTDIEKLNVLEILPAPESILRFRFHISGSDSPFHNFTIPSEPEPFERNGFTVTEWGVILGSPIN